MTKRTIEVNGRKLEGLSLRQVKGIQNGKRKGVTIEQLTGPLCLEAYNLHDDYFENRDISTLQAVLDQAMEYDEDNPDEDYVPPCPSRANAYMMGEIIRENHNNGWRNYRNTYIPIIFYELKQCEE